MFDVEYHSILLVISSLVITTNMLVIVLFATREGLRKAGKLLLLSLAISDLITGLVTIPLNIWCEATFSMPLCMSSGILNRFLAISTVYHILAVTLETYYAILRPMEHRVNMEQRKILGIALGIWLSASLIALIPLQWGLRTIKNVREKPSEEFLRKHTIYEITVFTVGFMLPLSMMVFAHVRMFSRILGAMKLLRSRSSPVYQPPTTSKYKTALLFAIILLLFTVSWSFWFVAGLLKAIGYKRYPFPERVADYLTIFRYSTSFINPLLYTFFRPDFYKAFKSFLKKADTRRASITLTNLLSGSRLKRDSQTQCTLVRETSFISAPQTNIQGNCARQENDRTE